jgi:hypothetical protein
MRFSTVISVLFHVAFFGAAYIVLPTFTRDYVFEQTVPFEIIREAEIADELSVPETRAEPVIEPEEPPEEVEETPVEDETTPEETVAAQEDTPATPEEEEAAVPPPPDEETEEPVTEEDEQDPTPTEEPKEEEPKSDPQQDFLSGLEDALKDLDPDKDTSSPRQTPDEVPGQVQQGDRDQERVGLGDRLTASEESLVAARVEQCWKRLSGAPEPEKLLVVIEFDLNRDGTLIGSPKVANRTQIRTSGNSYWVAAEQRAVAAVLECAPYDFLSPERYDAWKEFRFNFRPPAE